MKVTAMIMAGGRGERFWPKSRKNLPKQFLSLTDDGITMIQHTVNRILPLVDMEDIYIVTNRDYKALAKEQLPDLPEENILCEPVGRNTAPCVGLAAMHINKKYDDALMIVLPSDHLIKYNSMFVDVLKDACQVAEKGNNLTTIGITPNYPETGYGYIKFDPDQSEGRAYGVECFVEKPNLKKAKEDLADESYLWNSGMFVWKISTILQRYAFHFGVPLVRSYSWHQPPATLTFVQSYARSTASIMLVTVVINKRYETRINSEINFIVSNVLPA